LLSVVESDDSTVSSAEGDASTIMVGGGDAVSCSSELGIDTAGVGLPPPSFPVGGICSLLLLVLLGLFPSPLPLPFSEGAGGACSLLPLFTGGEAEDVSVGGSVTSFVGSNVG
jgi:hypothetical protein